MLETSWHCSCCSANISRSPHGPPLPSSFHCATTPLSWRGCHVPKQKKLISPVKAFSEINHLSFIVYNNRNKNKNIYNYPSQQINIIININISTFCMIFRIGNYDHNCKVLSFEIKYLWYEKMKFKKNFIIYIIR